MSCDKDDVNLKMSKNTYFALLDYSLKRSNYQDNARCQTMYQDTQVRAKYMPRDKEEPL